MSEQNCTDLDKMIGKLVSEKSSKSNNQKVSELIDYCERAHDPKVRKKVIKLALIALGGKKGYDPGPIGKHKLTQFLCGQRDKMTDKQRGKFVKRAFELPPDLQFSFGTDSKKEKSES
jgi:hypothetical protein